MARLIIGFYNYNEPILQLIKCVNDYGMICNAETVWESDIHYDLICVYTVVPQALMRPSLGDVNLIGPIREVAAGVG